MSSVPIYDLTIGVATKALSTLLAILKKAQEHPDAATFPSSRLHETMLPFTFQVQTVSNFSKKLVERLAARPADLPPIAAWADDETTMEQLVARVEKTLELLATVKPEHLEGACDKATEYRVSPAVTLHTPGRQYVMDFMIPNLFFHLSMAYAILRMKGVDLGKKDYLGPFVKEYFPKDAQ